MGPMILGHTPAGVRRAVERQMSHGILFGGQSAVEARAAELVCEMVPCAERVRFNSSGSEAVQAALRLARAATGRETVVKFAAGWGSPAKEGDAPDLVRVSAGTKAYAQGDGVDVTLKAPYAGEAQIAVATDHLIDFRSVHVSEGGATVHLKSSSAWA